VAITVINEAAEASLTILHIQFANLSYCWAHSLQKLPSRSRKIFTHHVFGFGKFLTIYSWLSCYYIRISRLNLPNNKRSCIFGFWGGSRFMQS